MVGSQKSFRLFIFLTTKMIVGKIFFPTFRFENRHAAIFKISTYFISATYRA